MPKSAAAAGPAGIWVGGVRRPTLGYRGLYLGVVLAQPGMAKLGPGYWKVGRDQNMLRAPIGVEQSACGRWTLPGEAPTAANAKAVTRPANYYSPRVQIPHD